MKKTTLISSIALATVFATLAFTPKKDTAYKINTQRSEVTWTGKKVTGEHTGKITLKEGSLSVDGKTIKGGSVEIDMNSITCTDLTDAGYNAKLVGHLKSKDFFNVEQFAASKFELTSVKASGEGYEVSGKLTIKGISNDISFPASVKFEGKTVAIVGKATVNRTKYDIKYGSASFIENIGDKAISDEFMLDIKLIASAN